MKLSKNILIIVLSLVLWKRRETKKPTKIFLFDEVDNALDSEKQQEFQKAIEKLVKQKKLVINAKRWEN